MGARRGPADPPGRRNVNPMDQTNRMTPDAAGNAARGATLASAPGAAADKPTLRRAMLHRRRETEAWERLKAGERLVTVARKAGLIGGVGLCGDRTIDSAGTIDRSRAIAENGPVGETWSFGETGIPVGPDRTVAAYVSMGTEIDLRPLLGALLASGSRVIVPRLGSGLDVGWSELRSIAALTSPGAGRPSEPMGERTLGPEALSQADLIILPALAVNVDDGTRLGRGGGWYDRALAHASSAAPVIAVCWPWEATHDPLPREAHDVPVDAALTPNGITMIGRVAGATSM